MTDDVKVLAQLDAAATTTETLYTVPTATQAFVYSINVCNRNSSAATYRLSVHISGAGADNKQYLRYDKYVAGNGYDTIDQIVLGEDDVLKTYASGTGLSFNVFGIETT